MKRGRGKTTTALDKALSKAAEHGHVLFIAHDHRHVQNILSTLRHLHPMGRVKGNDFYLLGGQRVSVRSSEDRLMGMRLPTIVDHFARIIQSKEPRP